MNSGPKDASILHLVEHEKFVPAFIALVNQHLDQRRHHFFFIHNGQRYTPQGTVKVTRNAEPASLLSYMWALSRQLHAAEKIVLHGLFNSKLILLLFLHPWLLQKCYWIIWGGDLYTYAINQGGWRWRIKELFRRPLIRNFGHLVTYVPGDVDLARQWYGAKGTYHECLIYPSNTFRPMPMPDGTHSGLQILIGNSADRSNNHAGILQALKPFKDMPLKVFAPLSYGDRAYAQEITREGQKTLGEQFVPLLDFMPYEAYLQLLAGIDIAIFNHQRQQGMGNIIALLGMGKTVYIRSDTSSWHALTGMGLTLGDTLQMNLQTLPADAIATNVRIVCERFSEQVLVQQLKTIFES